MNEENKPPIINKKNADNYLLNKFRSIDKTAVFVIAACLMLLFGYYSKTIKQPMSIHDAAQSGDIEAVKGFLAAGMDVNAIDENRGMTALVYAVDKGHKEIVEILISEGADVNVMVSNDEGVDGFTPLLFAVDKGHKEIVEILISDGADVNVMVSNDEGVDGFTSLFFAARSGHTEVAELLIANGAEVNVKLINDEGKVSCTPLFFAARSGHTKVAELLIANGSEINAKDENILTPLDYATLVKQNETADFLRKHGGKTGEELEFEGN